MTRELHGLVAGQGGGTPIALLHAFPLDGRMWGPQIEALSAHRVVLVPDLRGLGRSPMPKGAHSMEDQARDAASFLASREVQRCVLCGLSMGGYVALAFAALFPERMAGLVLADTRASADTPAARDVRTATAQRVRDEGPGFLADEMLPKLLSTPALRGDGELCHKLHAWMASQRREGVACALDAMRDRPSRLEMLPGITCPTLVIVGSEDTLTPPSESRAMADLLPGCRVEEIPGAGHLSNLEKPGEFNRAIDAFLNVIEEKQQQRH